MRYNSRETSAGALLLAVLATMSGSEVSASDAPIGTTVSPPLADQVVLACVAPRYQNPTLGPAAAQPAPMLGTIIASNSLRSYIVTAADPECKTRLAYVRGIPGQGLKTRVVAVSADAVQQAFPVPAPQDVIVLAIEKGDLVPASIVASSMPNKVSVALVSSDSQQAVQQPSRQKTVPVTSQGATDAHVTGPLGIANGTGVFDPATGVLLGVINRRTPPFDDNFSKWNDYDFSLSEQIRTLIPYLAENVGLGRDGTAAGNIPAGLRVASGSTVPVLHHEDVIGKPGFVSVAVGVAVAADAKFGLFATSLSGTHHDGLAIQTRDSDGALIMLPITVLARDPASSLAIFRIESLAYRPALLEAASLGATTVQVDYGFCSWQDVGAIVECVPRQQQLAIETYSPPPDVMMRLNIPAGEFLLNKEELGPADAGAPLVDIGRRAIVGLRLPGIVPIVMSMDQVAAKVNSMQLGFNVVVHDASAPGSQEH